jgi:hypothetical protein
MLKRLSLNLKFFKRFYFNSLEFFKMNKIIGKKEIILKLFKAGKKLDEIQAAVKMLLIDESFCSHVKRNT